MRIGAEITASTHAALGKRVAARCPDVAKAWAGDLSPDGRTKTIDSAILGFFSLEMSAEQLATRIISEQTEIPSYRIRRGEIDRAR